MSKDKPLPNSTEQAMLTLDQLSQTIDVMSEVIDRLKRHLGRQLRRAELQNKAHNEAEPSTESGNNLAAAGNASRIPAKTPPREGKADGFDVEIGISRRNFSRKADRVIH